MDDLVETLATSFSVTTDENDTAAPHPRFSQYKQKNSSSSQEERRRQFLQRQKLKRENQLDKNRSLGNEEDEEANEEMDVSFIKKRTRHYKNQLMLSEWLVEVPSDLETDWFLILCPIGKRCLVHAAKGTTRAYNKSGYMLNQFPSNLPEGNRARMHYSNGATVLDCIYSEVERTYYILDLICWKGHRVVNSDTEFRYFWIQNKLEEYPEVKEKSSLNPYKFVLLPYYSCSLRHIEAALSSTLPFSSGLDGLLFVHKHTHYTKGVTPLACWLKAYMCPEMLNISVPESLCKDKPASYISMEKELPKAFEKHWRRKEREASVMDCDDSSTNSSTKTC